MAASPQPFADPRKDHRYDVLIHESTQLDSLIGRQQTTTFSIRTAGSAILIFAAGNALTLEYEEFPGYLFLAMGTLFIAAFFLLEELYALSENAATRRKIEVESVLSGACRRGILGLYDGPCATSRIRDAYRIENVIDSIFVEICRPFVTAARLAVILFTLLMGRAVLLVESVFSFISSDLYKERLRHGVFRGARYCVYRLITRKLRPAKKKIASEIAGQYQRISRRASFYTALWFIFVCSVLAYWWVFPNKESDASKIQVTCVCSCGADCEQRQSCSAGTNCDQCPTPRQGETPPHSEPGRANSINANAVLAAKMETALLSLERQTKNFEAFTGNKLRLLGVELHNRQPLLGSIDLSNARIDLGNIGVVNLVWDVLIERLVFGLDLTYRRDIKQNDESITFEQTQLLQQTQHTDLAVEFFEKSLEIVFSEVKQLRLLIESVIQRIDTHRHDTPHPPACRKNCPRCKGLGCHKSGR